LLGLSVIVSLFGIVNTNWGCCGRSAWRGGGCAAWSGTRASSPAWSRRSCPRGRASRLNVLEALQYE